MRGPLPRICAPRLPDDGSPVLVVGHKEPEMLAGFLGAVGSGHPYVPVDDGLPAHRVETIARMSGAAVILTPSQIAALPTGADSGELVEPDPARPFYLIFTSGSTGEPKGVVITAGCLDAFLGWILAEHALTEGAETFLNQAPFSFRSVGDGPVPEPRHWWDALQYHAPGGCGFPAVVPWRCPRAGLTAWVSTPSFAQLCLAERTFAADRLPVVAAFSVLRRNASARNGGTSARTFSRGPRSGTPTARRRRPSPPLPSGSRRSASGSGGPLPIGLPRPGTDVFSCETVHGHRPTAG